MNKWRANLERGKVLAGIVVAGALSLAVCATLVLLERSPRVSVSELVNNPQNFIGRTVEIHGTIIHVLEETSGGEVATTAYSIDDGTGWISASFRGDLPYSEQEEIIVSGTFKNEIPYFGPYAALINFVDIQEIREAT